MIAAVGSGGVAAVGGGGSLSSQYSSAALASQDGSVGHGSGVNLAPVVNINSGGGGVGAGAGAGGTRSGSASLPDMHLVTGHVNGNVVVWDPSGDDVQPVLLVGPDRWGCGGAFVVFFGFFSSFFPVFRINNTIICQMWGRTGGGQSGGCGEQGFGGKEGCGGLLAAQLFCVLGWRRRRRRSVRSLWEHQRPRLDCWSYHRTDTTVPVC